MNHRSIGYAFLRAGTGVMFLLFGIQKFHSGLGGFAEGMVKNFGTTWLPAPGVRLFAFCLPFAEVAIGALLAAGLWTLYSASFGALLVIVLTAGLQILGESGGVAHNFIYLLALYVLVTRVEENGFSLDRKRAAADPSRAAGAP